MLFQKQIAVLLSFVSVLSCSSTWAKPNALKTSNLESNILQQQGPQKIWPVINFYEGGDLAQYSATAGMSRNQTRRMYWNELMSQLKEFAAMGASVEKMLVPMANILMMFDQVREQNKLKDSININLSLESAFKAKIDSLYYQWQIQDPKLIFSLSTEGQSQMQILKQTAATLPLGTRLSYGQLQDLALQNLAEQVDWIGYGVYSNLGGGQFIIHFHMTSKKTGQVISFSSEGDLLSAINDVGQKVFDYFEEKKPKAWQNPQTQLQWVQMPINPNRVETGYSYYEAKSYCQSQGARLPFADELLLASAGGPYQKGGIRLNESSAPYAVADQRATLEDHWYFSQSETATGGPVRAERNIKGLFYCVKGSASDLTLKKQQIWKLIRSWQNKDTEVLRALHTVRASLGDFASDRTFFWGTQQFSLMDSTEEATEFLKKKGIQL